jgi:exopolysaccharide biosynthesis polyprenyl glycosylphosphotransferase
MDGMYATESFPLVATREDSWVRPRAMLAHLDTVAAALTLVAGYLLLSVHGITAPEARLCHVIANLLTGLIVLALLYRDGQYSSDHRLSRISDFVSVVKNLIQAFFVVSGVMYATQGFFTGFESPSRLIMFSDSGILTCLLLVNRLAMAKYQRVLFSRGDSLRKVLVLGDGRVAGSFKEFLRRRPWLGVGCAGCLPFAGKVDAKTVRREMERSGAIEVILALDPEDHGAIPALTRGLSHARIPFRIVPSLFEATFRATMLEGFELPVVNVKIDPLDRAQLALKRALDVVVSATALVLLLPVLLAIIIAVKLDSPGPILFRQDRVGRHGKHFRMLKFRTMIEGAEQELAALRGQNEAEGHLFKIRDDPRITRVGRLLRRISLDEVPQFLNVLWGEMSVVGPRPPLPSEVEGYETQHFYRLRIKPGITGLWQVSGRSNLSFEEMVSLDRFYIENWSLALDITILLKTAYVVVSRNGAH